MDISFKIQCSTIFSFKVQFLNSYNMEFFVESFYCLHFYKLNNKLQFWMLIIQTFNNIQPCGSNCPRAEGQSAKKIVCFARKIFVFHFFHFFFAHGSAWHHLQCNCYNLNVKFLIFSKKIYKVHSVEVWSQDPRQQK
jgi:hypothetical protein